MLWNLMVRAIWFWESCKPQLFCAKISQISHPKLHFHALCLTLLFCYLPKTRELTLIVMKAFSQIAQVKLIWFWKSSTAMKLRLQTVTKWAQWEGNICLWNSVSLLGRNYVNTRSRSFQRSSESLCRSKGWKVTHCQTLGKIQLSMIGTWASRM